MTSSNNKINYNYHHMKQREAREEIKRLQEEVLRLNQELERHQRGRYSRVDRGCSVQRQGAVHVVPTHGRQGPQRMV